MGEVKKVRVKDKETGLIYESSNSFVIEQWLSRPDKYAFPRKRRKAR